MNLHGLKACTLTCLLLSNAAVARPESVTTDLDVQVPSLPKGSASSKTPRNNADASVEAACKAARVALGPDFVELSPVNQTVVHENWYVTRNPFV